MSSNGFGHWQFSEKSMPRVMKYAKKFDRKYTQDDFSSDFNIYAILMADDRIEFELPQNKAPGPVEEIIEIDCTPPKTDLNIDHELPPECIINEDAMDIEMPVTSVDEGSIPFNQSSSDSDSNQPTETLSDENSSTVTDLVKQLEDGPTSKINFRSVSTNLLLNSLPLLNDISIVNLVDAICQMKAIDQVRFNSIVATQLFVPLIQKSLECSRHIMSAFTQFFQAFPQLGCTQMLPPLLTNASNINKNTYNQIVEIVKEMTTEQQKLILLKLFIEELNELTEPHLQILMILICPFEEHHVKQKLIKLLAAAANKFSRDIKFGKLLVSVIQHFGRETWNEEFRNIVNSHETLFKKKALSLLNGA